MKYIYPQFSDKELFGFRLGGPGLGNLLFIYSRALVLAKNTNSKLIYPTWRSIKIGPWIRREKDKRFYGDLFRNNKGYVSGFKKFMCLNFYRKSVVNSENDILNTPDKSVLLYNTFEMNFNGLKEYRELIKEDIYTNLMNKNRKPLGENFDNAVNVHIRLGDFFKPNETALKEGKNNTSIPISWYVKMINNIKAILGKNVVFNIFSDGSDEELKDVLSIQNTRRVFYGTSIADIIALSRSKLIIASGSSFSMWARFLGNSNSISYVNQRKDLVSTDDKFEIECDETDFNEIVKKEISDLYNDSEEEILKW